jgi:molecular chaperone IbpA
MTSLERRLTTLDLPTLYKNAVGIDRWLGDLREAGLSPNAVNYPPYNVLNLGDNKYQIEIACAGFTEKDISITLKEGTLLIEGTLAFEVSKDEGGSVISEPNYLYRGISSRSWTREFTLADYVEVTEASMKNGMLVIALERQLPEALKPRQIPIVLR